MFALYLPQFHPIPQNDSWWGPGFTEWTNVAKARPMFPKHIQPRLPRDLGFYDLRVPEVREQQAELARGAGVEGFCYWHYWFGNGRRIIERPFQEVLDSRKPDFPFSLAWANQSWTGIWHGTPNQVLMKQEYPGRDDEVRHFELVRRAFEDPRYQTVDGKPVFTVFQPHELPSAAEFIDHWRELAHKAGFPGIYFVAIADRYRAGVNRYNEPFLASFDAVTPHPPHDYLQDVVPHDFMSKLKMRIQIRNIGRKGKLRLTRFSRPARYDYAKVVDQVFHDLPNTPRFLPSILPGWDNTPRSAARGVVFEGATPELFARYLQRAVDRVSDRPPEQRIIFLKAWNEWAEGNYVEPDALNGHAYLDAIRRVLLPPQPARRSARDAELSVPATGTE